MKKMINICLILSSLFLIIGCNMKSKVSYNEHPKIDLSELLIIAWEKRFEGKFAAAASSIQQTQDGGYIVAGGTCGLDSYYLYKAENYDPYIIKLDSNGELEWEKIYGGKRVDFICSIQQTQDGGYICAGYSGSFDNSKKGEDWRYDAYVIKLNSKGNLEWEKNFGGKLDDSFYSIQQTKDGGYIAAGRTVIEDSDGSYEKQCIIKLDSNGELEWEKIYGLGNLKSIQQTKDGRYIAAGDRWDILCIDSEGNLLWQKNFSEENGFANCIQQTKDRGFIVVGERDCDIYVLKLDKVGNVKWEKTYGGKESDFASSIQQTKDEGYIIAGEIDVTEEDRKGYAGILKLDKNGNLEWQKKLKSKGSRAAYIQQTKDGGYIVAGNEDIEHKDYKGDEDYKKTKGVIYILKLDFNGKMD